MKKRNKNKRNDISDEETRREASKMETNEKTSPRKSLAVKQRRGTQTQRLVLGIGSP